MKEVFKMKTILDILEIIWYFIGGVIFLIIGIIFWAFIFPIFITLIIIAYSMYMIIRSIIKGDFDIVKNLIECNICVIETIKEKLKTGMEEIND
jgi:hypothetical protein